MSAGKGKLTEAQRARQARSRALDKEYKALAAKAKRMGILSNKVNARVSIKRGTRTKLNKFRDVFEGKAIAVRAKPEIRKQYTDKEILEARGPFLIAPKQYENARGKISRGLVEITRPLKKGTESYVILPYKPIDMRDLLEHLKNDPTLDGLKMPTEQFSFRMYGHDASRGFVDMHELAEHVELKYAHWFKGTTNEEAIRFITFQRFNDQGGENYRNPVRSKEPKQFNNGYKENRDPRNNRRQGTWENIKRKKAAKKKAKQRKNETPEQRATRLAGQAKYQAQYRQRKFLDE